MSNELQTTPKQDGGLSVGTMDFPSLVEMSKKYPRDIVTFKQEARELATSTFDTAKACVYCRPVGKKNGKQTFAEGASVRLAEILQSSYGNLWVVSRVTAITDDTVTAEGVVIDLQKNIVVRREKSKSIVSASGNRYSDTQVQVMADAVCSIARRNAINDAIPKPYQDEVMDACKARVTAEIGENIPTAYAGIMSAFNKRFGISEKQIKETLDVPDATAATHSDIFTLLGIYNYCRDGGNDKIQEVFGGNVKSSKPAVKKTVVKTAPKKEDSKPEEPEQTEEINPDDYALEVVKGMAKQAGYTTEEDLVKVLKEAFSINSLSEINEKTASSLVDYFQAIIDQQAG